MPKVKKISKEQVYRLLALRIINEVIDFHFGVEVNGADAFRIEEDIVALISQELD